jgi:hypothetical protein
MKTLKQKGQPKPKKGQSQFSSTITKDAVIYILNLINKDAWMLEDVRADLVYKYKIDPRTAINWTMMTQKVEMRMRKGMTIDEAMEELHIG